MESTVGGLTATTVGATRLQHPSTRSPRAGMRDKRILFNDFTFLYELFRLRRFGAAAEIASACSQEAETPATRCDKRTTGRERLPAVERRLYPVRQWWAHLVGAVRGPLHKPCA